MSSFVIFDPRDNLIFHHCDLLFRKLLSETRAGSTTQWRKSTSSIYLEEEDEDTEDEDDKDESQEESVRNLITLYLTPYVSALRDSQEDKVQLDFIPSIAVGCKTYQEFIFLHLVHHKHVRHNEDNDCIILLQRKVNLFCQLTVFLCGNALYTVSKNETILQLLFRMLTIWNEVNLDIPFMLESIEKICVGFHIENMCKEIVIKLVRNINLELKTEQKEILTHCYVLFREKLIYQHMSSDAQIHTEDLALILLLTLSQPSSCNSHKALLNLQEVYEGVHLMQQLVFLQSPSQIPVPYLFRKITISTDLHVVCLSEISSIMMISLPTLIQSVIRIKIDINQKRSPSTRSLEKLVTCVRNADKYIQHNLKSITGLCSSMNMNSLDSLTSLARKARNHRSELVAQQTDRILTHLMDKLHSSYETVFRNVYFEMVPRHIEAFSEIAPQITCDTTLARLSMCTDFIRFKYDNQVVLLGSGLTTQPHLLAFIFVNRTSNFFVLHHQPQGNEEDVKALYQSLILQAYQKSLKTNESLVTWNDSEHLHSYYCWTSGLATKQKHRKTGAVCNIVNIIESELIDKSSTDQSSKPPNLQRSHKNSKYKVYELFCIYSKDVLDSMIRDYIQTTASEIEYHFN